MPFSVLISLYFKEHPKYLRQSLDSVFSQTLRADEVILVEDGPLPPELDSVVKEYESNYSEMKVIPLPINQGLGKALNEGLKYCSYDIVARMDTDDIAISTRFEKQINIFNEYPQADVVSSWIEEFDTESGEIISERKLPEFPFEIYEYGKKRCPINHPAVMFRKGSVQFAGGYKAFPLFEDYYLWVRLLLNGAKFYNVQESLLRFRTSKDMYRRRGGLKHAIDEVRFQRHIKKLGYISWKQFFTNVTMRFIVRIIPNSLRTWIYRHLLRK